MNPLLTDVPETMLWTLHNRASEAAHPNGCIRDEKCLEIYRALDYDYQRHFGRADSSHAMRSKIFDQYLTDFLALHPNAAIINLGEGLETQRYRIDAPEALWFSVDLPAAIEIRERFIQPDAQHIHVAKSALDISWFAEIPPDRPTFITAQGLFMYFCPSELETFIHALAERFPGGRLMFDYINHFLSNKTLSKKGWWKTKYYQTPQMPWGIRRDELSPVFSRWIGKEIIAHHVPFFVFPRKKIMAHLFPIFDKITILSNHFPGITYIDFPSPESKSYSSEKVFS